MRRKPGCWVRWRCKDCGATGWRRREIDPPCPRCKAVRRANIVKRARLAAVAKEG